MPQITRIRTAQNVLIELPIAGLDKRIWAYLIDMVIIIGYLILYFSIVPALVISAGSFNLTVFVFLAGLIPVLLYHLVFEQFNNGQSPGKRALNIRVVREDEGKPTFFQYFLRWILRLIDFSLLSGLVALIIAASNDKRQRLGDMVAGTVVIYLGNLQAQKQITLSSLVKEEYKPAYPLDSELTGDELKTIREVLDLPYSPTREELIEELAQRLEGKYGISRKGSAKMLLYDLLKDHMYYERLEDSTFESDENSSI